MKLKKLNDTDLSVSPVCLGTVNYGSSMPAPDAKRQLSEFIDLGGNFVDTAHVYGNWGPGLVSPSEKTIGEWFRETGKRSSVILATKGAHPEWTNMNVPRVRPKDILFDLEESLKFLETDYIDIYFLHRDDPSVPVGEIVDCLDAAVEAGKIRYYGCSNWSLDRVVEAAGYAKARKSRGFVVNQLMLSLADINFNGLQDKTFVLMDGPTRAYHAESGMNVMAYMSIAKAYFTRRQAGERLPSSVTDVYENESNDRIYRRGLEEVEKGRYSFMDLSLMYVMAQKDFPSVPIASFDTPAQLREGLSCWDKEIPESLIEELSLCKQFVYGK